MEMRESGMRYFCPNCGKDSCHRKKTDFLKIKLKEFSLKHPEDNIWYDSHLPVFKCELCKSQFVIEWVNK